MTHEQAERAILRWCRVRGHDAAWCRLYRWRLRRGHALILRVSVQKSEPCAWLVRVGEMGFVDCTLGAHGSYSEAWLLGADLARALERRGADGRRL